MTRTARPRPRLRAVILDVDGTLVDSNEAHAAAWHAAFREHGVDVPLAKLRKLIGMGGDHLLPAASGLSDESDLGERISRRRGEIFRREHLPRLQPLPGARDLLRRFADDGLVLAVATSAPKQELEPLLCIAGAADLVGAKTSSGDVERSKPAPDVVAEALARTGCAAGEALMLGDSPYDLQAARRAGVGLVALRSGGYRDDELAGAVAIYDHPADLLRHYASSPFAGATVGAPG